ncbi:MAG: SpoIVB peptidase S55 domain-containing protein [Polyangiaceae bacterium]
MRRRSRSVLSFVGSHTVGVGLALGALAGAGIGAGVASAAADPSDVLPLSEVKPGMQGYGLTVFSGTEPEKFDVEVISVLKNFRPNQDLILIKTPNHPRLDAARVVAGMSGSPIYLKGKMVGAYAYGWIAGVEPIAGVTPIKSMLDELARPIPKAIVPGGAGPLPGAGIAKPKSEGGGGGEETAAASAPRSVRAYSGNAEGYDLLSHAKQLASKSAPALAAPQGMGLSRAATPIMLGGVSTTALKIANDLLQPMGLDPVQAGGGGGGKPAADAPTKYVDGGAIGVQLIRGDMSAMGLGTVTRVSGDKLLAFGHPMLNGGIESFPTAIAKVHWILASFQRSFKIGEAVRPMGALVNDRQAAIVVDSQVSAPTIPMVFKIEGVDGAPKTTWNMEVTHDRFMAPMFAAMAMGNAVETTTSERRDMTWRATSKLKVAKFGTLTFEDFGAGDGGPPEMGDFARGRLVRALGALMNNPWEDVKIESIDTTMAVTFDRDVMMLKGAKLLDPEIDAGESVRIELTFNPHKGKQETRTISVPIPAELAGREVDIELAPGYEVERPQAAPNSVAQLVAVLPNQVYDGESIVATVRIKDEAGAAFGGKVASRLPAGALDTLRSATDSDGPEVFSAAIQNVIPMKRFVIGRDTVRVKVRAVLK